MMTVEKMVRQSGEGQGQGESVCVIERRVNASKSKQG